MPGIRYLNTYIVGIWPNLTGCLILKISLKATEPVIVQTHLSANQFTQITKTNKC